MLGTKIRVQQKVDSSYGDDQLLFLKQMGIKYVYAMFRDEDTDYDSVMKFVDKLTTMGFVVTDGGNTHIYKNASIHLGLPDRDRAIERYKSGNAGYIYDLGAK